MPRGIYDRSKSKPRPRMSEEQKRKISISEKGKIVSKETRIKISLAAIGKTAGFKHYNWKGGISKHCGGYIRELDKNNKDGRTLQHRLVMEKYIGRRLTKKEVVHHINGIRTDNRIENLMLFATSGLHSSFHCRLNNKLKT